MEHLFTGVLFHSKCLRTPFYIYALAKTKKNLIFAVYVQFVPTAKIRIFLVFAVNVSSVLTTKTRKNLIFAVYVQFVPRANIKFFLVFAATEKKSKFLLKK